MNDLFCSDFKCSYSDTSFLLLVSSGIKLCFHMVFIWLNIKYDSKIIYFMMVEKISEKNLGSKREDWRNLDD